jgi:hypothetical protein
VSPGLVEKYQLNPSQSGAGEQLPNVLSLRIDAWEIVADVYENAPIVIEM